MAISPTAEGFRVAYRRPALTLAEIAWRWSVGATATVLSFYGLFEYLNTLPVTSGELLFLRTRQPYFVAKALQRILYGSLNRAVLSAMVAAILLGILWTIAASLGRIATVSAIFDFLHARLSNQLSSSTPSESAGPSIQRSPFPTLIGLNFLRASAVLAAIVGTIGAAILAGWASSAKDPQPGLVFLLFLPMAALVWLVWYVLNWLLSLAAIFAVRDHSDAAGSISSAVGLCRDRLGAVAAVTTWTGLAHLVIFVGASSLATMPLAFAGLLPGRLILLVMLLVTLAYLAVADWLYVARLAGYICAAEMPLQAIAPLRFPIPPAQPLATTIDRNELILSDLPNLPAEI